MAGARHRNTLPVDKGWAWAIAGAGFIAHVAMSGSNQTNSVLFVEILRKYEATITAGSILFMSVTLSFSFTSVVITTFVLPKLGERKCLLIGGVLDTTLSLLASFAPNIGMFIAFLGMKGIAHGLIFVPSMSLIRYYFKRWRSRASIIPWCGGSTATIIGPFVIRALRKEYGISGTYLILAAVELHVIVAAMLLRPISAYKFRPDEVDAPGTEDKDETTPAVTETGINDAQDTSMVNTEAVTVNGVHASGDEESTDGRAVNEALLSQGSIGRRDTTATEEKAIAAIRDLTDSGRDRGVRRRSRRNTLFGSVMTLDSDVGAAMEIMIEDVSDGLADKELTIWQRLYRDSSLELWSFRWALFSMLPGTVNTYVYSYLPTIANSQGASLDQAAQLVTIMGSVDMVSRICCGFISDAHLLQASNLLAIAHVFLGVAANIYRFSTTFPALIGVTIFIGLFVGTRGPLSSLMCLEVVGTERMPQAYSISSMLNTFMGASFNPILGVLAERTGSFIPVMHVIGSGYLVSAVLLSLIPLFVRLDAKQGRVPTL